MNRFTSAVTFLATFALLCCCAGLAHAKIYNWYQGDVTQAGWVNGIQCVNPAQCVQVHSAVPSFNKNFINLQDMGFSHDGGLAPNIDQLFAQWGPTFVAMQANSSAAGLFLGDELCCTHHLPIAQYHTYVRLAKSACPACLIWSNECKGTVEGRFGHFSLPPELDIFSIDYYTFSKEYRDKNAVHEIIKPFYHQYVLPLLHQGQMFGVVPPCTGWSSGAHDCDVNCHYEISRRAAKDYAEWCAGDGRCAGVFPWYYSNYPAPVQQWACVNNSFALSAYKSVAGEILNS